MAFKYINYLIKTILYKKGILKKSKLNIKGRLVTFNQIGKSRLLIDIFTGKVDNFLENLDTFEPEVSSFLLGAKIPYDCIVDAGSNTGILSACAEIGYPKSNIIAIEPIARNYNYILDFKSINNFKFKVINCCLGEREEITKMYIPYGNNSSIISTSASLYNSFIGSKGLYSNLKYREEKVIMRKLDSILEENTDNISNENINYLIKVDCEGAELEILKSTKLLESNRVDLIVEIMIGDNDKNDIFNLLIQKGFDAYLMTPASLIKEDRPLTLPKNNITNRTMWRNHFFTKKSQEMMKKISIDTYGKWI